MLVELAFFIISYKLQLISYYRMLPRVSDKNIIINQRLKYSLEECIWSCSKLKFYRDIFFQFTIFIFGAASNDITLHCKHAIQTKNRTHQPKKAPIKAEHLYTNKLSTRVCSNGSNARKLMPATHNSTHWSLRINF